MKSHQILKYNEIETVKGTNSGLSIGIDIGKYNYHVTILRKNKTLSQFIIKNNIRGFTKFKEIVNNLTVENSIIIALEATGHYYKVISTWLVDNEFDVLVINPARSKHLRLVISPNVKTDIVDSYVLAKGLETGLFNGLCQNEIAKPTIWEWYLANLDNFEKLHPFIYQGGLTQVIIASVDFKDEVIQFFSEYVKKNPQVQDPVDKALETMEIRAKLIERYPQ